MVLENLDGITGRVVIRNIIGLSHTLPHRNRTPEPVDLGFNRWFARRVRLRSAG
jgi:hypothetical protein